MSNKICLGDRSGRNVVRCIKEDGKKYFPPWGKEPKFYFIRGREAYVGAKTKINEIIIVSADSLITPKTVLPYTIKIPINKTEITAYQCWTTDMDGSSVHLASDEFVEKLKNFV